MPHRAHHQRHQRSASTVEHHVRGEVVAPLVSIDVVSHEVRRLLVKYGFGVFLIACHHAAQLEIGRYLHISAFLLPV
jgi:hypothetical protein